MIEIINISGYKFIELSDLPTLKTYLLTHCVDLGGRRIILNSPEGINIVMAGTRSAINDFTSFLHQDTRFADITFKESISDHYPFNRMLVRIKKEIIAFGVEGIHPESYTSTHLDPKELKKWLDERRDVVLLDTRNDYEVKLGTFKNAIIPHIDTFRDFPKSVQNMDPSIRHRPVVTFCTGGIRCEKAAAYLESQGFKDVYQIKGGILKYFEECGGAHWDGDCFVFDHRVALTPELKQSSAKLCFKCRAPLTADDLKHPHYIPSVACGYCFGARKKSSHLESQVC